ncbi:MAG TPA: ribbon-helix-helix protein, CopG family [Pirellulales bacterium]
MSLSVELDEETAAVVQQLAADENRSTGAVIRDALAAYASLGQRPLPTGMGKYHSGRGDTSVNARQILREAVEDGEWP